MFDEAARQRSCSRSRRETCSETLESLFGFVLEYVRVDTSKCRWRVDGWAGAACIR